MFAACRRENQSYAESLSILEYLVDRAGRLSGRLIFWTSATRPAMTQEIRNLSRISRRQDIASSSLYRMPGRRKPRPAWTCD